MTPMEKIVLELSVTGLTLRKEAPRPARRVAQRVPIDSLNAIFSFDYAESLHACR